MQKILPPIRLVPKDKTLSPMFVVGLGNPDSCYVGTRHNVGFHVVELMMRSEKTYFRRRLFSSVLYWDATHVDGGRPLTAFRWTGYMNSSGGMFSYVKNRYVFSPDNLFVVVDNMDLPPGSCRLKRSGGDAGHNGLKSLINALGTKNFPRIYIGIGRPHPNESVVDHVLGRPEHADALLISEACQRSADALFSLRTQSFSHVAENLNSRGN